METFEVEVLIVGHGGGDTPGDGTVMAEMGQPGTPGNDSPTASNVGASQMILIEHVRRVERAMGVAGEQRSATGGALAGERPSYCCRPLARAADSATASPARSASRPFSAGP